MSKIIVDSSVLSLSAQELDAFCRANGIHRLLLFGSALREEFGPDSDIDLLVEFDPDVQIGFMALGRMQRSTGGGVGSSR
jgi:uncharacterized protein